MNDLLRTHGPVGDTYRERLLETLVGRTLYYGRDASLEGQPGESGMYLVTPALRDAPDVNAYGVFPDHDHSSVHEARVRFERAADFRQVAEIVQQLGVTLEEIVATDLAPEAVENHFGPDEEFDPGRVGPEYLLRVERVRNALLEAGYDAVIGWHVVTNYEVPFVAVWREDQIVLGDPVPRDAVA